MKVVIITGSAHKHGTTAALFRQTAKYLEWEAVSILNAKNASVAADLSKADLNAAYELGKSLK